MSVSDIMFALLCSHACRRPPAAVQLRPTSPPPDCQSPTAQLQGTRQMLGTTNKPYHWIYLFTCVYLKVKYGKHKQADSATLH